MAYLTGSGQIIGPFYDVTYITLGSGKRWTVVVVDSNDEVYNGVVYVDEDGNFHSTKGDGTTILNSLVGYAPLKVEAFEHVFKYD